MEVEHAPDSLCRLSVLWLLERRHRNVARSQVQVRLLRREDARTEGRQGYEAAEEVQEEKVTLAVVIGQPS